MSSFGMTRRFHEKMLLPVHDSPREPTDAERILRAKLLFEETMETIEKGLGVRVYIIDTENFDCSVSHGTGFEINDDYDPVETLDGLADVKVIANGTAVQFGLPMEAADHEVFNSNMSKLDDDGNPVMNCCINEQHVHVERFHAVGVDCQLRDSSKPVGKILKGHNFREPRIAELLESVCDHHASQRDPKICGGCGIHIESLR